MPSFRKLERERRRERKDRQWEFFNSIKKSETQSFATLKRGEKIYRQKKRIRMRTNKRQTRRNKIFQNSTRRLVEIKLTLVSHNHRAFLRAPAGKRDTFWIYAILNFLSHTLRWREMNSLEVLNASSQCPTCGAYPVDRLPRVWTRSTAIANTDDHNRPGEHWIAFYIDEHGTGMYFDACRL